MRSSSTVESRPPENPTHTASPGGRLAKALLGEFLELPIVDPAFLAPLEKRVGREVLEASQAVLDRLLEALRRLGVVAMGASQGLAHHLVDDAQRLQARRGDREGVGRLGSVVRALPEDRGAAFGRD